MAQTYSAGFFTITSTGVSTAVTGTSTAVPIPNASDGNRPRFIRVSSRNEAYVKLGTSSVVATNQDILVQPGDAAILAVPNGITHIGQIQGTTAGFINVVPLENI
jgi:hypothetical protein